MEIVDWEVTLGTFHLGTLAWEPSLAFAWELSLGMFRLGTVTWDLPLGSLGISLGESCLGSVASELSFCRLGTLAWEIYSALGSFSLGSYRLESFTWRELGS